MLEYTNAFLKAFPWAKAAYDFTLGLKSDQDIALDADNLTSPILATIDSIPITVYTDTDWNLHSRENVSLLGGLYTTINQGESYLNSLYTKLNTRMAESEKRINHLESILKSVITIQKISSTTSISIGGGDSTWIETDSKFYKNIGPLEKNVDEGCFRLKDTGHFSSIRSLGGFAGEAVIERSLGQIVQSGTLEAIVDGTRDTFWMGTFYTPAPIRADSTDIPWLPSEYKHGFAFMLTYYLDRPSMASEIFIDPVTTEAFDLVSISWTPLGLSNTITCSTFESTGACWSFTGNAMRAASIGIDDSYGLLTYSASGWGTYTFAVSGDHIGHRAQLVYNMKGAGDCRAGARLVWLDSSGNVIDYRLMQEYPSGFYIGYRLVDIVPPLAVSGRVDLGIFSPTTNASAMFDEVSLLLGEQSWYPSVPINKPTTISLPRIVLSGRYSFVFAQRNPRREVLVKSSTDIPGFAPLTSRELNSALQTSFNDIAEDLRDPGPGNTVFAYKVGLKELDLRYREYIPRGQLVSLPIKTQREVRRLWVTTELGKHHTFGSAFYIYPFQDDPDNRVAVTPFRVGDINSDEMSQTSQGDILNVYTQEEVDREWNADSNYITINPKHRLETFDGTDREGKLRTATALHLRLPLVNDISDWLDSNAIWPTSFDPNAETLYGFSDTTIKDSIRTGDIPSVGLDDLESRGGYIPVKVTVKTDRWVAHPDTFGRPDKSRIRSVAGEILAPASTTESVTDTSAEIQGFDAWLTAVTLDSLVAQLNGNGKKHPFMAIGLGGFSFQDSDRSKTLKQLLDESDDIGKQDNNAYKALHRRSKKRLNARLKHIYEKLRGQGKITEVAPSLGVTTTSIENGDTFATRFKPIVTGPSGSFIRLWWYDEINQLVLPMSQKDYKIVNPNLGVVAIQTSSPGTGYINVMADYKYIGYSTTEDHFSSVLSYVSVGASGIEAITGGFRPNTRAYPITRNMTDYVTGKVPELTPPNFDRTSRNYYPIIEYYVNSGGEIVFAREFFKYGDQPASVLVEYDTLGISPRVGVSLTRGGSPSVSATVYSLSLKTKERSSSLERSTD